MNNDYKGVIGVAAGLVTILGFFGLRTIHDLAPKGEEAPSSSGVPTHFVGDQGNSDTRVASQDSSPTVNAPVVPVATTPSSSAQETESSSPETVPDNWRRTVVFIFGETVPGQALFIRGGVDETYARHQRNCRPGTYDCAIPIRHRNWRNGTNIWKRGERYLDWVGPEPDQSESAGTPLEWTTDRWPSEWGSVKTVLRDGHGEERLNRWGRHYWMLDVDMDCSRTIEGWFEFTSFITNGPGGERDISQPDTPYKSKNHFARCGGLNVFRRDQDEPVFIGGIASID